MCSILNYCTYDIYMVDISQLICVVPLASHVVLVICNIMVISKFPACANHPCCLTREPCVFSLITNII